jgi:hypothetical protein
MTGRVPVEAARALRQGGTMDRRGEVVEEKRVWPKSLLRQYSSSKANSRGRNRGIGETQGRKDEAARGEVKITATECRTEDVCSRIGSVDIEAEEASGRQFPSMQPCVTSR